MNNMTWLDLYRYLNDQANKMENLGKLDWNSPIMVHDAETGQEYFCDTYIFNRQPTITINIDAVMNEKGTSV